MSINFNVSQTRSPQVTTYIINQLYYIQVAATTCILFYYSWLTVRTNASLSKSLPHISLKLISYHKMAVDEFYKKHVTTYLSQFIFIFWSDFSCVRQLDKHITPHTTGWSYNEITNSMITYQLTIHCEYTALEWTRASQPISLCPVDESESWKQLERHNKQSLPKPFGKQCRTTILATQ